MKFKEKMNQAAGFTLVELIVVIAILAILAGVAVPVYSGYIEKANLAADQQLLAAVNKAFAAACAENGTDNYQLADGSVSFDMENMTVSKYAEAFDKYFKGNENSNFKVIEGLVYKNGQFIENPLASLVGIYSQEQIAALMGSAYLTADGLGIEGLLNKVVAVTDIAAGLIGNGGRFDQLLTEDQYLENMAAVMGYDLSVEAEANAFLTEYGNMVEAKALQLRASGKYESMTDEQLVTLAENQIKANNAVLVAAKNTTGTTTEILETVKNGFSDDTITDMINGDTGMALSNAAAAYALYTAYAYSLPAGDARDAAIANTNDIGTVLNAINTDTAFKAYLENTNGKAEEDLAGYLAAMEMINNSTGNELAENVLVNGFDSPELLALLEQLTNGN